MFRTRLPGKLGHAAGTYGDISVSEPPVAAVPSPLQVSSGLLLPPAHLSMLRFSVSSSRISFGVRLLPQHLIWSCFAITCTCCKHYSWLPAGGLLHKETSSQPSSAVPRLLAPLSARCRVTVTFGVKAGLLGLPLGENTGSVLVVAAAVQGIPCLFACRAHNQSMHANPLYKIL